MATGNNHHHGAPCGTTPPRPEVPVGPALALMTGSGDPSLDRPLNISARPLRGGNTPQTPRQFAAYKLLRNVFEVVLFIAVVSVIWVAIPVQAHSIDCGAKTGVDLLRCERHQKMAEQCGPLVGEAHFACDREFLLSNPLSCQALGGDDPKRCASETAAMKRCEPKAGREFLRCVRDEIKASPMGSL